MLHPVPAPAAPPDGLSLDGEGPVWLQIRRALAQPILSGAWPPGTRIPGEIDLTAHFGASRMTVNKAIQSLANEGLLRRRRKVGTVVSARAQARPSLEIWDAADLVAREGGVYAYRLLEQAPLGPDPDRRALIALGPEAPVLWIRALHLSDGAPFQLEERLIHVDAAPGVADQPLETVSPTAWLLAHVPWTEAEHAISAAAARADVAEVLEIAPGAPCLVVERRTWNGPVPITFARLWRPGDRHRLVGRYAHAG
jgi:GntR family histidine utilization transcriptional repressor